MLYQVHLAMNEIQTNKGIDRVFASFYLNRILFKKIATDYDEIQKLQNGHGDWNEFTIKVGNIYSGDEHYY
jgi:hypothetical protein